MKLLCAVAHRYTCTPAQKLVVGSLVNILKASPATHVVDKNRFVSSVATDHISQKSSEFLSMFDLDPALSRVCVSRCHDITMAFRVCLNSSFLIDDGILLFLCGHAHILRCGNQGLCLHETSKTQRKVLRAKQPNYRRQENRFMRNQPGRMSVVTGIYGPISLIM